MEQPRSITPAATRRASVPKGKVISCSETGTIRYRFHFCLSTKCVEAFEQWLKQQHWEYISGIRWRDNESMIIIYAKTRKDSDALMVVAGELRNLLSKSNLPT